MTTISKIINYTIRVNIHNVYSASQASAVCKMLLYEVFPAYNKLHSIFYDLRSCHISYYAGINLTDRSEAGFWEDYVVYAIHNNLSKTTSHRLAVTQDILE